MADKNNQQEKRVYKAEKPPIIEKRQSSRKEERRYKKEMAYQRKMAEKEKREAEKGPRAKFPRWINAICWILAICLLTSAGLSVAGNLWAKEATKYDEDTFSLANLKTEGGLFKGAALYAQNAENPEQWDLYQRVSGETGEWIPLDEMSPHVADAVLAVQDPDYYDHSAAAPVRTLWRWATDSIFSKGEAASTLEQQLVRRIASVKLPEESGRIFTRKIKEMSRARDMGNSYTKPEILEAYLNTLFFENGVQGISGASHAWFSKAPTELTLSEAAIIAGAAAQPEETNPVTNPGQSKVARDAVLNKMLAQKRITEEEATAAKAEPIGVSPMPEEEKVFSWFADVAIKQLKQDFADQFCNGDLIAAQDMLTTENYKVYLTVDVTLQQRAEEIYSAADTALFPVGADGMQIQSGYIALNYNGGIAATVGGVGAKVENLADSRATGTWHMPGSAIVPVSVYTLAINEGLTNWSSIYTDKAVIKTTEADPEPNWPLNKDGRPTGNNFSMVDAVINQTNTIAVQVGQVVGEQAMYNFLGELGLEKLSEYDLELAPLTLGSLANGVSALELASMYQLFSTGAFISPRAYSSVVDTAGQEVLQKPVSQQVISTGTAYVMRQILIASMQKMAGQAEVSIEGLEMAGVVAGNSAATDFWYAGMTPQYISTVWLGADELDKKISDIVPDMNELQAALIAKNILAGVPHNKTVFDAAPSDAVEQTYCVQSGGIAKESCPEKATGWYTTSGVPQECTLH